VYSKLHSFYGFLFALAISLPLGLAGTSTAQAQTPPLQTPASAAPSTTAATATVRGHIADPSGALIPGANVTIATSTGTVVTSATADATGAYTVNGLKPGSYIVQAAYAGFAPFKSPAIQLAAGQSKRVDIAMAVEAAQQSVVVTDDSPTVSVEAGANSNSLVLKGKDLDALSDDPDELSNELSALAGPSAGPNGGQIYIDGFTGGELPPKSAIREIRINQNPYSAEFDHLGYGRIEILTKPGTDKLHGQFFAMGNDKVFNTGNPFTQNIPDYHSYHFNGTLNGSLSKSASFFISAERRNTQNANVYDANTGTVVTGSLLNPHTRTNISPRIDLQLGQKNTLTLRYQFYRDEDNDDLASTISLPTQAYSTTSTENTVQVSDSLIINEHIVNETRFQYLRDTSSQTPSSTAPSVSVSSYFTGGGSSSQQSKDHTDHLELQNLTTMSLGAHAIKLGMRLRDNRDANSTDSGFNGSFSFDSLDAYNKAVTALGSGTFICSSSSSSSSSKSSYNSSYNCNSSLPSDATPQTLSYTTGPQGATANVFDAAVFFQDDWKANKLLTLSGGLRWESQNHISDHSDWAPRVSLAYALDGHKNNKTKTVLRAGYGIFYDRFSLSNELSATRYSGSANSQTQYTIKSPTCFADISFTSLTSDQLSACGSSNSGTSTIYQIAPHYHSPYTQQFGASLERQATKTTTVTATYLHSFGVHQQATRDSNACEQGTYQLGSNTCTRPDSTEGVVKQFYPEAVFKQDQLILNINARITPKFNVIGFYNFTVAHSDDAGGTASNSSNLSQDYGRASFAARNMVVLIGNYEAPWGIRFNPFLIAQSGKPYNIVTNNDLTGDNFYNNRPSLASDASLCTVPAGTTTAPHYAQTSFGCLNTEPASSDTILPMNMANGPAAVAVMLRVSRTFGIGPKVAQNDNQNSGMPPGGGPPGGGGPGGGGFGPGGFGGGGGRPPRGMFDSPSSRKYNLSFNVQAQNLFNNIDYGTPSGTVIPTLPVNPTTAASTTVEPGRFGESTSLAGGPFSTGSAARRIFFQASFSF
jgi:hypothetical protein